MQSVKQRLFDILDSVPEDFFDGLKPTEKVFKLMFEYLFSIHRKICSRTF